jgi:DNA invertase Pin-like site-specific DNA recombinase
MKTGIVGYLRVSTKGQGESGLGLEAQRAAVEAYARQNGVDFTHWYTEVESGKRSDRPELAKALAHAKRNKCKLVVAKLDRLSRNLAFLSALMESKVPLVCCDNPAATELTLGILAVIAQHEAKAISERTKAALTAYKARGGKLGGQLPQCRNLTPEAVAKGRQRSIQSRAVAKVEAYADLLPTLADLRAKGLTLQGIAGELNGQGHTTRTGKPWNPVQVKRVLDRSEA